MSAATMQRVCETPRDASAPTIAQQLAQARAVLVPVSGANAGLEARLLAAHAWGMSAEALVLHSENTPDEAAFAALLARRLTAEPVAYIVGRKDFWKSSFHVSSDVLTPRADSETMIECLLRQRRDVLAPLRLLDLGTGSGCLLLSALGEYANARGVGVDQSPAALGVAAHNAAMLGLTSRVEMLRSNWCSNVAGMFDVILSNPPYIATADIALLDADVRDHEPHAALDGGADGLDCYRDVVRSLAPHVQPGALLLFEVGETQAKAVAVLAVAAGWRLLEIANDLAGIARVVALEMTVN
jgi:release factor glutamine methyltransferase